ncbi:MAG: hypothetical protein J7L73_06825 [Anaerolineales bacterium]|nr:hypothetical protein [Anaerolineales bacterium]
MSNRQLRAAFKTSEVWMMGSFPGCNDEMVSKRFLPMVEMTGEVGRNSRRVWSEMTGEG